ncbi:MAG: hypothetical protein KC656_05705 [Myxococcales bacterium]|nr:hypothetical protein [Myxococcales bacterium]
MIALVPFALATTLTLERTDKGGLSWEIAAEEGWKVGRDPEPEVRIDLVGAEGSTAIDVPAKGAMGPQILQLLPDLEQLQVRARLQVCREDL